MDEKGRDPRTTHCYASCYCEENVWKLSTSNPHFLSSADSSTLVVFISNQDKRCPLWSQRAQRDPDTPVCWDYHVIFLAARSARGDDNRKTSVSATSSWDRSIEEWEVWDLDSTLPFPCSIGVYLAATFPYSGQLVDEKFEPKFRVICAREFRALFRSDRSHMRNADGSWIAEPPPWLPLLGDSLLSSPTSMPAHESANNLDSFIDMTQTNDFGEAYSSRLLVHSGM